MRVGLSTKNGDDGYSMTGGRVGMRAHIAQFPANLQAAANAFETAAHASGIDAIFFTDSEPDPMFGPAVQRSSIKADPNP